MHSLKVNCQQTSFNCQQNFCQLSTNFCLLSTIEIHELTGVTASQIDKGNACSRCLSTVNKLPSTFNKRNTLVHCLSTLNTAATQFFYCSLIYRCLGIIVIFGCLGNGWSCLVRTVAGLR